MSRYFITGTDTDVGKTLSVAAIAYALKAYYWKPVQSGVEDGKSDQTEIQNLTDLDNRHFLPATYTFKAPLSPNQASKLEDIEINIKNCKLPEEKYPLIVEGVGGVYVPINEKESVLDLMQQLDLPIVVVTRGTLGTLNHTLMTLEILRQRKLKVHGVIYNGHLNPENQKNIEDWSGIKTLFHIPYFENLNKEDFKTWVNENQQKIKEAFPCP